MTHIRAASVAGLFYPEKPEELESAVHRLLGEASARGPATSERRPVALIAPHAGYDYSGPIAASAFACLSAGRDELRRVILVGPSHHVRFDGVAVSRALAFDTPLGAVPVDLDTVEQLLGSGRVIALEAAHAFEHALEVELPFLIEALETFSIVPLITGRVPAGEVADVLELAGAGEPNTLVVVSSDLSHYHTQDVAKAMDLETARAIENNHPVTTERACGHVAINGLIELALRRSLTLRAIDVRTSADTVGDPARVVGYGAFAAFPREE